MRVYNKLVRDRIPEIIREQGNECEIQIAQKEDKYKLLEKKLQEEVYEFFDEKNIEELADIMEVLFGLAGSLGYTEEDLLIARNKKREERGGFEDGIILKSVR